jgi:hypothetical protein
MAIAAASTCGSVGLMVGPAVIGFVAQSYNLLTAMLLPVALLVVLTCVAFSMHWAAKAKYKDMGIID